MKAPETYRHLQLSCASLPRLLCRSNPALLAPCELNSADFPKSWYPPTATSHFWAANTAKKSASPRSSQSYGVVVTSKNGYDGYSEAVHWTSWRLDFSILQDTDISIISDFGGKTPRVNALRFHIYCICGTVPRSKDAGHGLSVPWHGWKMPSLPGRNVRVGQVWPGGIPKRGVTLEVLYSQPTAINSFLTWAIQENQQPLGEKWWNMVKRCQKIMFKIRAWRNCPHGRLQVHLWSPSPWAPKHWVVASRWRLWYCQWAWAMWDLPQIWQTWRIWQWIKLGSSHLQLAHGMFQRLATTSRSCQSVQSNTPMCFIMFLQRITSP